jgi:hypothetical protein
MQPSVYIASISAGFLLYGSYPLFFELCVEVTFPIPEGCTSGILVGIQAAFQSIFLSIPPDAVGTAWYQSCIRICVSFVGAASLPVPPQFAAYHEERD